MATFLILLFFVALFVVFFVFSLFFSVLSRFLSWLGFGRLSSSQDNKRSTTPGNGQERSGKSEHCARERRKLFADDEGEYVDFEEIK
jgi:hypothetical protein